MCGRFIQSSAPDLYAGRYAVTDWSPHEPNYNVAPTQPILVIRPCESGEREMRALRWGLIPHWSKGPDSRYSMINARAETVHEKPAYRSAFKHRRCLIPGDGFYEWQKTDNGKQPYLIRYRDGEPFVMAGLWEHWQGPTGEIIESCTIIVTAANSVVEHVHDRMPVVLTAAGAKRWLDPALQHRESLQDLLQSPAPDGWSAYPVSRRVNSPQNNDPELLKAL